ncbi:MAG: hypothetical protein A2W90_18020 [Bacteroidetes bacterium GWF2_42_66]|nr:MAG: hypothetical protein A2W92_22280 [Bacteroidetes bacterium GWA2_42_15]OFX98149.1 MAG: hypothetical protein A2W89_09510 [Bacteroidetes bacterium GWE2_42_39]OFY42534.1 MAG: hypothetical protein A2W90_18020 [Bacteroidetes bacterium GWF2_42_66]HBL74250.1 hypothetical protein [Prolixibacteraceae bacterium]HCU64019.1 hypothetical protein [Prolixibacteraceae bacterium]
MKGVLTYSDFTLQVNVRKAANGLITGGLVIGDNTDQCAAVALQMQQGELKEDPLLGAGLTKFIRGKYSRSEIDQRIRQHLTRAGINYQNYKQRIALTINAEE